MNDSRVHPTQDLQLLAEGRLPPAHFERLQAHLEGCSQCRRELGAMREVRSSLAGGLPRIPLPPDLAGRIASALDSEVASQAAGPRHSSISRRSFLGTAATLATAAGLGALWLRRRSTDPVAAAAAEFERFASSRLELEWTTAVPAELERRFADRDIGFPVRVFDFGMMDFGLVGGGIREVGGRQATVFAYRGGLGGSLVCHMYVGSVGDLPDPESEALRRGIRFLVYERGGATLVFWQEGSVVCGLVTDRPTPEAIDLADAKAVVV